MMNKIQISVIIPIYNTEQYLERSIQSVMKQKVDKLEIILVDDGSEDGSSDICDRYGVYENVKVLHLNHQGQGRARNEGLRVAQGEYIAFVDSDDYIEADMYKDMLSVIEKKSADLVVCDMLFETDKNRVVQKSVNGEFSKENYLMNGINLCSPCNKLFKRNMFSLHRFPEIAYEDMALIPLIVSECHDIVYLSKPYYHYCRRNNSTSMEVQGHRIKDMILAMDLLMDNMREIYRPLIEFWIVNSIVYSVRNDKKYLSANFSDFLRKHKETLERNSYIARNYHLKEIMSLIENEKFIPKRIVVLNTNDNDEIERSFENSIKQLNPDYEIVILECAERGKGNYRLVTENIRQFGGFAISSKLVSVAPLDYIRSRGGVIGFRNRKNISLDFWGDIPNGKLVNLVSQAIERTWDYEETEKELTKMLQLQYNLKLNGRTQSLNGNINVMNPGYFLYCLGEEKQIMKISGDDGIQMVDKQLLESLSNSSNICRPFGKQMLEEKEEKNAYVLSIICLASEEEIVKKNLLDVFSGEKSVQVIIVGPSKLKCLEKGSDIIYLSSEEYTPLSAVKFVSGRFCGIFNEDFIWSQNVLQTILIHMLANENCLDMICLSSGEEECFKVVDVQKNYKDGRSDIINTIIKSKILKNKVERYGGDDSFGFRIMIQIILERKYYGILYSTYFRIKQKKISELFSSYEELRKWLKNSAFGLRKDFIETEWKRDLFLQFQVMYNLQGAFWLQENNNDEDLTNLRQEISEVLEWISDTIILEQKDIYIEHKVFVQNLKYQRFAPIKVLNSDVSIGYGKTLLKMSSLYTMIDFLNFHDNRLSITGRTMCLNYPVEKVIPIFASVNGSIVVAKNIDRSDMDRRALNVTFFKSLGFHFDIEIDPNVSLYEIQLFYIYEGNQVIRNKLLFGPFSALGTEKKTSYCYMYPRAIYVDGNKICLRLCGRRGLLERERNFQKEIMDDKTIVNRKEIVKLRTLALLSKYLRHKPIWLLSDKLDAGDDNAEAFFQYLSNNKRSQIKSYFVLEKNSKNYKKIKKEGHVVPYLSWRHKLLFLLSERNISSQSNDYVMFPFAKDYRYYRDLTCDTKFVFLQHGITQNDLSGWLHKYNRNISYFITAAQVEYDSILQGNYHYTDKEVVLTGFARFDKLYHNEQKIITVIPTWRKYLYEKYNSDITKAVMRDGFEKTAYYQFYRGLLSDERLHKCARENGYRIALMIHPNARPFINYFSDISDLLIFDNDMKYTDVYAISDLMVTDYSSAVFDFAYLRKPVVYCQFDKEDFYGGTHSLQRGYFEYEDMGFGEVETTLAGTIERMMEYMENGCQLKDKYRKRIDDFFAFDDNNNCQRIYETVK